MSLRVHQYDDARAFLAEAETWLLRDEAHNSMLLGLASKCAGGFTYGDEPAWFATVHDGERIVAAAWRTPPFPLGVTQGTQDSMMAVFEHVQARGLDVPKIHGPLESCERLASLYAQHTDAKPEVLTELLLFRLDELAIDPPAVGTMRKAEASDTELILDWSHRFEVDAGLAPASAKPAVRSVSLEEGRIFLWMVDGAPVAMAASARETRHGVSVNGVFTPRDLRGRGHATALVSSLSQSLLDGGKDFCCLYTDLANPTSNSIYRKIGYREIGRYRTTTLVR